MAGAARAKAAVALALAITVATCALAMLLSPGRSDRTVMLSKLTYGEYGTIPADMAEDWRKINKENGGYPYPDGTLFDATNSDVWAGRGSDGEDSWLDPKKWVADRKMAHMGFKTDKRPEVGYAISLFAFMRRPVLTKRAWCQFADGQWWPRRYSSGVSPPENFFASMDAKPEGPEDLLEGVKHRYDNPTQNDYMDYQYHRLIEQPHRQKAPASALNTVPDAVKQLDEEAAYAPKMLQRIFSVPMGEPPESYTDKPAFPESF